jgi:integrase
MLDATTTRTRGRARPRFSDDYLRKLKLPPGKSELIQFETGTGLGIRASTTNISFLCQLRLKDGTRWRETIGPWGKLSVDQARAAVAAIAGEIALGVDPRAKRKQELETAEADAKRAAAKLFTVAKLIQRWSQEHLASKRPGYRIKALRRLEHYFGSLYQIPAVDLTRKSVRDAMNAKHAKRRHGRQGGPAPIGQARAGDAAKRNAAASLRACYRWAFGEEILSSDPLNGLKLPKRGEDRARTLTIDEARRIYAAAATLEYPSGPFVRLLLLSGCRRAEIAGLRWDEVDLENAAIQLPPARTKTGAGHHVALSSEALRVIGEAAACRILGSPYVFTSDGWRAFGNFARTKQWLDEELARTGEPILDWRLHDSRRSIVTYLASRGFDPVAIDLLLGHAPAKLSAVARIYQRFQHHDKRREMIQVWAEALTASR